MTENSPSKTMSLVLCFVHASQQTGILIVVSDACLCGYLCVTSHGIMHLLSQASSIVLPYMGVSCWLSPSASWVPVCSMDSFAQNIFSCRCVIDAMLLDWVCFARLIRAFITLCSASFRLFLLEFVNSSCGRSSSIGVWSIKV